MQCNSFHFTKKSVFILKSKSINILRILRSQTNSCRNILTSSMNNSNMAVNVQKLCSNTCIFSEFHATNVLWVMKIKSNADLYVLGATARNTELLRWNGKLSNPMPLIRPYRFSLFALFHQYFFKLMSDNLLKLTGS